MTNTTRRFPTSFLVSAITVVFLVGCDGSTYSLGSQRKDGGGGQQGSDANTGTGGGGAGGQVGSGGGSTQLTGGSIVGGSAQGGSSASTGGVSASGGRSSFGGALASGGVSATAGKTGSASGGSTQPTGGSSVGGSAQGGSSGSTGAVILTASVTDTNGILTTWHNGTAGSIFLYGCGTVDVWKKTGTDWVERNPGFSCAWEGVSPEVLPGSTYVDSASFPPGNLPAGTYRLSGRYGVGCTNPELGLSQAGCTTFYETTSNELTIGEVPDGGAPDVGGLVTFCIRPSMCGADEYCAFSPCAIETGRCTKRPTTCPSLTTDEPVCACDMKTQFSSSCQADMAGVSHQPGLCPGSPNPDAGSDGTATLDMGGTDVAIDKAGDVPPPACAAAGGFCTENVNYAICPTHYEPVEGDGHLDCGVSGLCCVPAPSSPCSDSSATSNCLVGTSCTGCWIEAPGAPACEAGRICCYMNCN
jgi:hypothetical protein